MHNKKHGIAGRTFSQKKKGDIHMKKLALISAISLFVTFLLISVVPRPGDAEVTYYGCYVTKDGSGFHIVPGPGRCKKNETEISWNNVGPEGILQF